SRTTLIKTDRNRIFHQCRLIEPVNRQARMNQKSCIRYMSDRNTIDKRNREITKYNIIFLTLAACNSLEGVNKRERLLLSLEAMISAVSVPRATGEAVCSSICRSASSTAV